MSIPVIFTTGFDEYAVSALRHGAIDYLIKPIDRDELKVAITRYRQSAKKDFATKMDQLLQKLNNIKVRFNNRTGYILIDPEDIMYCEAAGNYTIIYLDNETEETVSMKIKYVEELINNDDEDYDIEIWSYIYKGNKAYSGERESNKQSFVLDYADNKIIKLNNIIEKADLGDYNLKVRIRKNNQKTTKDMTESIIIKSSVIEEGESLFQEKEIEESWLEPSISEAIVYESTSFKSENIMPLIFILSLTLLTILLVLTKTF